MLNFRNTVIVSVIVLAGIILFNIYHPVNILVYFGIIIVLTSLFVYGSAKIQANFYLEALNYANTNEKTVALTFDDGPGKVTTPEILDILKRYESEAAFFCIGANIENNPELLKRIDHENHIIASHSYSHHRYFDLYSTKRMEDEFKRTEQAVFNLTGKKVKLFRPPYGVTNPNLARAAAGMKYRVIGWSLKSRDTVITNRDELLSGLKRKVKPGDIILFHDTKQITVEILPDFIGFLNEHGYRIARLDKLLQIDAYEK